jgi:hypothetical protein
MGYAVGSWHQPTMYNGAIADSSDRPVEDDYDRLLAHIAYGRR